MGSESEETALGSGQEGNPNRQTPTLCPICGGALRPESTELHTLAEEWVIEQIKKDHPNWVREDGACPKCLDFYMKL